MAFKPSPEQLLALLQAAIREAPKFEYESSIGERELRWLGHVDALLEAMGPSMALASYRTARSSLNTVMHDKKGLMLPLYDALSKLELAVPSALQGAFIPPGETWDGYAALLKLIQRECDDLLIVDPYLNSDIYTYFAPLSGAHKLMRCLTANRPANHSGLIATASKWVADPISQSHPVAVRYASSDALHDRLIIIDKTEVWLISQSIKDIAKRSPASVTRAEAELAAMKAAHYDALWQKSAPLT